MLQRCVRFLRVTLFVVVAVVMVALAQPPALAAQSSNDQDKLTYADGKEFVWDGSLFENPPTEYDKDLAVAAAYMCKEEDTNGSEIEVFLKDECGFIDAEPRNFDGESAYCIGHTKLFVNGTDTTILVVVARGSKSWFEFIGDRFKGDKVDFLGERVWNNVHDFEKIVWGQTEEDSEGIGKYLDDHPEVEKSKHVKILVTGHSLGGAAANMIAARMTTLVRRGEWLADKVSPDDIYCYTFGAINVLADKAESIDKGFENIHNVYNKWDSFGPYGNWLLGNDVSTANSKWGHPDMLLHKYEEDLIGKSCKNHDMGNYLNCVRGTCENHCEVKTNCTVASDEEDDLDDEIISGDGWCVRIPDYWRGAVNVEKANTTLNGEKVTTYDVVCDDVRSTRDDEPVSILLIKEFPSQDAAKHLNFGDAKPEATTTLKSGQEVSIYTSQMGYEMLVPLPSARELVIFTGWQTGQGPLNNKDTEVFRSKVLAYADLQSFGAVTSFDDYTMDTCMDCITRVGGECVAVDRVFQCDGFTFTVPATLLVCDGVTCDENGGWPLVKKDERTLLWLEKNQQYWDQAGEGHVTETRKLSSGTLWLAKGDDSSMLACLTSSDGRRVVFGSFVFGDKKAQELGEKPADACRACQASTCGMDAKDDAEKIASEFMKTIAKGVVFDTASKPELEPEPEQGGEHVSVGGYTFELPAYWNGKVEVVYDKPSKFMRADQNATVCVKGTDNAILCLSYKQSYDGQTWASPVAWAADSSRVDYAAPGATAWVGLDGGGAIGNFVPSKWFSISRLEAGGYSDDGPDGYDSQEVSDAVADLQGLGTGARPEELMRTVMATARPE